MMFSQRAMPVSPAKNAPAIMILLFMMAIGAFMLVTCIRQHADDVALVAHGVPVTAEVVAVYDQTKGGGKYMQYEYSISGQTYKGRTDPVKGDARPDYGTRGPIQVYYLPEKPEASRQDPKSASANSLGAILFTVYGT